MLLLVVALMVRSLFGISHQLITESQLETKKEQKTRVVVTEKISQLVVLGEKKMINNNQLSR